MAKRKWCIYILVIFNLLVGSLLLAACGSSPTPTVAIPNSNAPRLTLPALITPTGDTTGKLGPTVGADGQITVVAPTANPSGFNGTFFWVKNNNIWQGGRGANPLSAAALGGAAITKVDALAVASYPSISPDGTLLAYAFSPEPDVSNPNKVVIGQDIVGLDLKTNQTRLLVKRPEPDAFLDHPNWSADGKYLYYSYRSPLRSKENIVIGQKLGIQRLEIASGKSENLIEDAREPYPSPDGKSVVYVGISASTQTYENSLQVLDLATKKSTPLTKNEQSFQGYYMPRISPDGQTIVFAAIGGPDTIYSPSNPATTPTPSNSLVDKSGKTSFGKAGLYSPASNFALHGLPYDLWTVKPDGTGLKRLTTLFEDQPMPVWSKDGKQIIFLAGLGLYTINADGTNLAKITSEGGHGGFTYLN